MTTRLEEALRETLDRLADEARPAAPATDLAAAAVRRADRRWTRRAALTALTAVVATFAVVVPTVELLRADAPPPVAPPATSAPVVPPPAPTPTPPPAAFDLGAIELPGGWMLGAAPGEEGGFWVWDRSRQTYRQVPYKGVYPAPLGDYAVVVSRDDDRVGVLDVADDKVRWLDGLRLWVGPDWSGDGDRFLMRSQSGPSHVLVVTARTGKVRPLAGTGADGPEGRPAFWMPGDREVATWVDGRTWKRLSVATGRTVGALTAPGVVARTDFAPNGDQVVGRVNERTVLVDVRTGEVGATLPDVYRGRAYWVDTEKLLFLDGQGKVVTVVDRDGQRVGSYPLPAAMDVDEGHNYTLIRM